MHLEHEIYFEYIEMCIHSNILYSIIPKRTRSFVGRLIFISIALSEGLLNIIFIFIKVQRRLNELINVRYFDSKKLWWTFEFGHLKIFQTFFRCTLRNVFFTYPIFYLFKKLFIKKINRHKNSQIIINKLIFKKNLAKFGLLLKGYSTDKIKLWKLSMKD